MADEEDTFPTRVNKRLAPFDPEGSGYDMSTAQAVGLKADPKTGHWPSRVPSGPLEGLILKGRRHETWHKAVEGDKRAGYGIRWDSKKKRYYSKEDPKLIRAPHPSRLAVLKGKIDDK